MDNVLTIVNSKEIKSSIDSAINEMSRITPKNLISLRRIYPTIIELALSNNTVDPSSKFNLLSTGAYKACYSLDNDWVIKLTRNNAELRKERASALAAYQRDIGDLFLSPIYITSPGICINSFVMVENCQEPEYVLEDFDTSRRRKKNRDENPPFNVIMFQQKATFTLDDIYKYFHIRATSSSQNFIKYPEGEESERVKGLPVKYAPSVRQLGKMWEKDVLRYYGEEFYEDWCRFKEDWDITDLHYGNLGYVLAIGNEEDPYAARPVVVDWMSMSEEDSEWISDDKDYSPLFTLSEEADNTGLNNNMNKCGI